MTTTRFCLVRHGETDWNVERRLQGFTDIPLNEKGVRQANQMASALQAIDLQFDVLYASDLQRAAQTAQAIEKVFGVSAIAHKALRERNLGALQGLTTQEAPDLEPELWNTHLRRSLHEELRGGESIAQFANRIKDALEQICLKHAGKTVLLVSHGGALDMMYRIASNQALDADKAISVPNASLSWISHDGQSWKVDNWADVSHLEGLALDNLDL
ncbi:histidine phosphatase family protein [Polynucleobacter asymbioticus]|jgi:probable phosphoglycerate mutase|uniref:Phosphoglycerate mutase n=2 Tax=Polynucleobacter asymbioticus TaxID=576611 RepID=A4T0I6_POLAQ|nr:histidine phosphatase family protein [Polynucleobacter asymbioticus]ABP35250.1 phosphoglycerate mutase [Polynucleobacter asymbioticus QLW-P1DMWA-1]APB99917.1 phosphoglycerate kinase [Polynucleobacter asymbioticus]APC02212.1 phosphoglycerate kinase [Polynucleobacter asymbioticus]APC07005.1 phosphoglycerate kinase [Polynucleobacter asymbioticus]